MRADNGRNLIKLQTMSATRPLSHTPHQRFNGELSGFFKSQLKQQFLALLQRRLEAREHDVKASRFHAQGGGSGQIERVNHFH